MTQRSQARTTGLWLEGAAAASVKERFWGVEFARNMACLSGPALICTATGTVLIVGTCGISKPQSRSAACPAHIWFRKLNPFALDRATPWNGSLRRMLSKPASSRSFRVPTHIASSGCVRMQGCPTAAQCAAAHAGFREQVRTGSITNEEWRVHRVEPPQRSIVIFRVPPATSCNRTKRTVAAEPFAAKHCTCAHNALPVWPALATASAPASAGPCRPKQCA